MSPKSATQQGIMALPEMDGMAPSSAMDDPRTMGAFEQFRKQVSPKEFSNELLNTAAQVDPQAVQTFRSELASLQLPIEAINALNDMVDEILESPENYAEIRDKYLKMEVPEDLLPEQFDPQFFGALNLALDQLENNAKVEEPRTEAPEQFAKGGIATLTPISMAIAKQGRHGDTMLAHISPSEAKMLRSRGGAGTINPRTGLPEYFNIFKEIGNALKGIGNAVKSFAQSTVGKIVTTVALGFFLGPAAASMLGVSSAAGVAAVGGFIGGAGSTLLAGGNLASEIGRAHV